MVNLFSNTGVSNVGCRVTVVIVTYNSRAVVGEAIASIPVGVPVIVVDNASRDGTTELIRRECPAVKVIANQRNVGFGPANNIALAGIDTEFALLMNPDARFNQPGAIERLLDAADRYPEAAILGPAIVMEDGTPQSTLPAPLHQRRELNKQYPFCMDDVAGDVCAYLLSGALMLVRMSAFNNQSYFFDPNIFMYFEDDDICMSANQRGFATIMVPSVTVMHLVGQSSLPGLDVEVLKARHKTFAQLYVMAKYGRGDEARKKAIRVLIRNVFVTLTSVLMFRRSRFCLGAARLQGAWLFLKRSSI